MEEKINSILAQHRRDEVMLDAFFQWATNPTSMSAGYRFEENYPYIKKNLELRYRLSPVAAEKHLKVLVEACDILLNEAEQLPDSMHRIAHVQMRLKAILSEGEYGNLRTEGVMRRLREASEDTRKALLLFNLLENVEASVSAVNFTESPTQYRNYQSEFQAYYKSIFGEVSPVLRVAREIIVTGVYNELYWVPSPTAKSRPRPTLVKAILPSITQLEALGTRLPSMPDVPKLLEPYWEKDVEVLRLIDIVSHSNQCIMEMDEPLPVNVPDFVGLSGKTVALSPMVRDDTMQHIELAKEERIWPIKQTLEKALLTVEGMVEPQAGLAVLWAERSEVVWKFTTTPPLYIYLAPWLTTSTQTEAPSRVNFLEKPHVLFVIPFESRTSFLAALEKHSEHSFSEYSLKETRWERSLGILTDLERTKDFQQLVGERHPLIDKIFNALDNPNAISRVPVEKQGQNVKRETSKNEGSSNTEQQPSSQNRQELLKCFETGYVVTPVDKQWLKQLEIVLHDILSELGIECIVDSDEFQEGPRLIRANIKLGKGLRINKVSQAAEDIANKLFANHELFHFTHDDEVPKHVRIESVPAKGMVGIYVPRNDFCAIPAGALLEKLPQDNQLSFIVGVNVIGEPQFSNLDSMPHLLVAGQAGAGKSVFLNTMIVSLAFQNDPSELQFILIDPKGGLEFGPYEILPHVFEGKITRNSSEAVQAMNVTREEMDRRYNLMSQESGKGNIVRNVKEYNSIAGISRLPYRVIIIDEFADLVLSKDGKDIVEMAQAIAQKGRAAGIHMVICTQRPSVKVIPGDIKAVIPSRLSFRLPTGVDSKVILDELGAEDLLGKGDMFLKETVHPELRRFQGSLVTNAEIQKFALIARSFWSGKHPFLNFV
jgi:hypothetical protein